MELKPVQSRWFGTSCCGRVEYYTRSENLSASEIARLEELLEIFRSHEWITDIA
jgi:hypothetical protein